MKLVKLQKKVADVLGVSSSQKNLAFEIFIDKISEILLEGITIKVPRIGFFQLKAESAKNGSRPLIFSPLSEDFLKDARQLYLTIDVAHKTKNTSEFDSNIFSIGVGKPLLPLSTDEQPDTETSYAMLKKSIEERVKELLTESDQIPNFNIWDDYYKSPEKFEDEAIDETKNQLSELTSDLKFKEEKMPGKIPENIHENYDTLLPGIDKSEPPEEFNQFTAIKDVQEVPRESENTTVQKEDKQEPVLKDARNVFTTGNENNHGEETSRSEEDYSALEKLQYDENQNQQITIADLLEDMNLPKSETKIKNDDEYIIGDNIVPVKETLDRILADEKIEDNKSEIDNPTVELQEEKISAFEELHKLNDEVISHSEVYEALPDEAEQKIESEKIEENENKVEISSDELEEEKISAFEELHQLNDEVISHQEVYEAVADEAEQKVESEKVEENENKVEISSDELEEEKISAFEELHQLSDETISSQKIIEEQVDEVQSEKDNKDKAESPYDELVEQSMPVIEKASGWNNEEEIEETDDETKIEDENERVEWNWGDELREEFGIPKVEGEEARYEMVDMDEETEGSLRITDDFLDDNETTKDLFDQLEKTLDREFNVDEASKRRFTNVDKKSTIDRNNLKKVVLEFSGPPSKYEFVEDRSSGKEKRMAITLIDEDEERINKTFSGTDKDSGEKYKENYFKKMALIIFGSFVIVGSIVVFIILKGNGSKELQNQSNVLKPSQTKTVADTSIISTPEQIVQTNKDTSATPYELNDFPRTAVSPVPIKDATDKQILETIKRESAKLQSSQKVTPTEKQTASKTVNQDRGKNVITETRVSDRVYYDGKNYNIQVSSWPNRARAEEELNRLRKLGLNAIIVEANLPQKGGMWYRVRLGPFKSQKEAEENLKKNNL